MGSSINNARGGIHHRAAPSKHARMVQEASATASRSGSRKASLTALHEDVARFARPDVSIIGLCKMNATPVERRLPDRLWSYLLPAPTKTTGVGSFYGGLSVGMRVTSGLTRCRPEFSPGATSRSCSGFMASAAISALRHRAPSTLVLPLWALRFEVSTVHNARDS